MNIVTYKCPCCDGALEFNGEAQKLKCPYCDSEFTVEAVKEYNELKGKRDKEDIKWEEYNEDSGTGKWTDEEKSKLRTYICPACAGEIVADETTGATKCIYCGNPTIIPHKFEGTFKPDIIIPFRLDKKKAVEKLTDFYKGKILLPKVFKEENKIQEIKGIYVPFWLYDCDVDATINYRATRVRTWSDRHYNYIKTDYFLVKRSGEIEFGKVPADASKKMDDSYMDAIEPFDYKELKEFIPSYLSGYYADKYDVDAKSNEKRVSERIKKTTEQMFEDTVHGYATVMPEQKNIGLKKGQVSYALLPVWMLNTKYNGEIYTFAMNGQTGKFIGKLPIDKKNALLLFLGVLVPVFIILTILFYVL